MAIGLFRHWTHTQLTTLHEAAVQALIDGNGMAVTRASAGDTSVERAWAMNQSLFWEELSAALDSSDPSSATSPVTRTSIRYV